MIKKIIALCLSIPFIFCGCGYEEKEGDVSNVKIHEFSSELYTEEDVNAAADEIKDFFKFDNSKELKDIKLVNYEHQGKIAMPVTE